MYLSDNIWAKDSKSKIALRGLQFCILSSLPKGVPQKCTIKRQHCKKPCHDQFFFSNPEKRLFQTILRPAIDPFVPKKVVSN